MAFSVPTPIQTSLEFTARGTHRFFEDLSAAVGALSGYHAGIEWYAGRAISMGPVRFVCFVEQAEIECYPEEVLTALVQAAWPEAVRLRIDPMPQPPSTSKTAELRVNQRMFASIWAHAFLTYYENIVPKIEVRDGLKRAKWHETLRFARMTRDAFGHGGKLDIRDSQSTASWRGRHSPMRTMASRCCSTTSSRAI